MNHFSDPEDKGYYCRFVMTADGSYILEPVKVPAHVIAAREERIRKRDQKRRVMENRRRAQAINARSLFFLAFAISVFGVICCAFLYMQNRVSVRLDTIAALQTEVTSLAEDNDLLENRLESAGNLEEIAQIAEEKLGMSKVEAGQIWKYSEEDMLDYMLQFEDIE